MIFMETLLQNIIPFLGGILFLFIGLVLFRHAIVLFSSRDEAFRAAANKSPESSWEALSGNRDPYSKQQRDHAISAGLAVNKDGKLIPQGRLSDEMIDRLT